MKLLQYRKGFATNSSSTHSIIIANRLTKVVMTGKPLAKGDDIGKPGEYGWEDFTLSTCKAKMQYLATQIKQNISDEMPHWMVDNIAFAATGEHVDADDYIDHQSMMALPMDWSGKGLDKEFLDELVSFIRQEDVMILGGSDNSDNPHPLACCGPRVLSGIPRDCGRWVARKEGNEWTLFCREDGEKITFTFDDSKVSRQRPSAPELIDIKCTNFCPFECAYCYQNSSRGGGHAERRRVENLARFCEQHKVFEVALGGGEPTLWPYFVSALSEFRMHGVVPNFTTRNLAWLRDERLRPEILESCGAFAVSVNEARAVEELAELIKRHHVDEEKVCLHYVLGSAKAYEFQSILRAARDAHLTITLLGWKSVGRGARGPLEDNSEWLSAVRELHKRNNCPQIGIDTAVANEFQAEIKKAHLPDWLFYTEEGKFSMYYDAVEDKWGPSSFCDESEYVHVEKEEFELKDELIEAWKKIQPVSGGKKKTKKE